MLTFHYTPRIERYMHWDALNLHLLVALVQIYLWINADRTHLCQKSLIHCTRSSKKSEELYLLHCFVKICDSKLINDWFFSYNKYIYINLLFIIKLISHEQLTILLLIIFVFILCNNFWISLIRKNCLLSLNWSLK